jgi:hypothetical protein
MFSKKKFCRINNYTYICNVIMGNDSDTIIHNGLERNNPNLLGGTEDDLDTMSTLFLSPQN